MNFPFEKRKAARPIKKSWEVIDVELATVFYCETEQARDDFKTTIENVGHRAIVKEVRP